MSIVLHGSPFSTFTWTARLALHEKGVDYELRPANLRAPEFAELHPWRRMPVLDHGDVRIFEAAAVCQYVDEAFEGPKLSPGTPAGRARMTQWTSAISDYIAPKAVRGVLIPRFVLEPRGIPVDGEAIAVAAVEAHDALQKLEAPLTHSAFLAGDAPTIADWLLAPIWASGQGLSGRDRYTDGLPHLAAWFGRVAARPSFGATIPR